MFSSSSAAAALSKMTRQLARMHVTAAASPRQTAATVTKSHLSRPWTLVTTQSFATNRKVIDAKNARRLKIQAKKKKSAKVTSTAADDAKDSSEPSSSQPFLQHQEWVKFQQSISVDGFQTGQTTTAQLLKKSRGGKQARRRRERELARTQQQQEEGLSTLKFPAIRYSPEETQALLERAMEALPKRDGKRGTRNLRRQDRRWKLVRDIRSKYKAHIIAAHERRMEKRQWKREQVKAVKAVAPEQREKDLNYQGQILQRWAETMMAQESSGGSSAVGEESVSKARVEE